MKILLVSASIQEIVPFLTANAKGLESGKSYKIFNHSIHILVTGVGMVSTTYALTKEISNKYDLVINAGIAGTFNDTIQIGEVVNVQEDCIVEMGAEDGNEFIDFPALGFEGAYSAKSTFQLTSTIKLKSVKGITVNKVHGNEVSISHIKKRYNPDIESMEGAAVLYVCQNEKIPCLQLRAISNRVEKRNKNNWNIPIALQNLSTTLTDLIKIL